MRLFATLYLDEDVSALVATLLRARGVEVITVREKDRLGEPDEDQLAFAAALGHCILTHNRLDFEELHDQYIASGKKHWGIVIASRRNPYEIARRVAILLDTLTADEIEGQLLYI